ncbi:ABC transporter substrate-binding protein [Nocardioides sp.]|uniref:ABC transporter substrate-binding protein n=1 Tax=Nocardioides sp. TaxID=35761 RepID=UPI002CFE142A|nr:ABC transporter substrate-binding protein [Nocardioides sp.]HVX55145.1 ABC transporter substrate-binding protein [Nocardioides sp.]
MPTVTIGKAVDTIGFSAVDVAQQMGYFKDAGVNVKTTLLQGSSQATAALQGGSIQFATLSSTALLLAASQGVKLQAVMSLDHGVSVQIVATKDWASKHGITPTAPLGQRMKGLEGAKDAAISSTGTSVLKLMMDQNGADSGKVDFVTVGSDAAGSAALGHGTLQVFVGSPPSTYYMADNANSEIVANATEVPAMKDMAYDILITNPSWAGSNPKTATAVATALSRAENLMATDPGKVIALEQKHFPSYSKDELMQSLKQVQWTTNGTFTQPMWDDAVKVSQQMGQLKGAVDTQENGLWTNKYIDTAKTAPGSN